MTRLHHWLVMKLLGVDWIAWSVAAALTLIVSVFVGIPSVML